MNFNKFRYTLQSLFSFGRFGASSTVPALYTSNARVLFSTYFLSISSFIVPD